MSRRKRHISRRKQQRLINEQRQKVTTAEPPKTGLDKIIDSKKTIADEVKAALQEGAGFEFDETKHSALADAVFFDENPPKCDISDKKAEVQKPSGNAPFPGPIGSPLPRQERLALSAPSQSAPPQQSVTTVKGSNARHIVTTKTKGTVWEHKRAEALVPQHQIATFLKIFGPGRSYRSYSVPDMAGYFRIVVYDTKENLHRYEDNKDIPF